MGKVKQRRHLGHETAPAHTTVREKSDQKTSEAVVSNSKMGEPPLFETTGLFSKVDIDMNALKARLPSGSDFDARSNITRKSLRGLNINKKTKLKLKRDFIKQKIKSLDALKQSETERKKRQSTIVVGDLRPLQDSLPTLELLLKEPRQQPTEDRMKSKRKAIEKTRTKQRQMMHHISIFQQVVAHPAYKADPMTVIREHLQNKLSQEK